MSRDKTRIRSIVKSMKKEGYSFWDVFLKYEDIQSNKPHRKAKVKKFFNNLKEN